MYTVAIICDFSSFHFLVVLLLLLLAVLSPIILFETVFYLINGPSLYLLGQKLAKKGRPRQNDSPVPAQRPADPNRDGRKFVCIGDG